MTPETLERAIYLTERIENIERALKELSELITRYEGNPRSFSAHWLGTIMSDLQCKGRVDFTYLIEPVLVKSKEALSECKEQLKNL